MIGGSLNADSFHKCILVALLWIGLFPVPVASGQTRTVRIATYNIEDDINGATTPLPGLIAPPGNASDYAGGGVLEGIGEEIVGGDPAQPVDVLALEETTSNPQTVTPIVNALNTFYGIAGMYSNSNYQATESGGSVTDGNGPNAMVFNTRTLQLLASTPVDPAGGTNKLGSSGGEYREVVRYEFAPAGVAPTSANEFYIYVSHYKSGTTSTDAKDRAEEAQIIRTNEAIDLPAAARVIYVGDYNVDNSGEAGYQTILSNTAPNGIQQGQGIDPLNLTNNSNINWSASTTSTNLLAMLTEHSYELEYRDDLQVMTTNVYYGAPGGFKYIAGTYHAFGNNGTTAYYGSVNSGADTALSNRLVTNGPVFISAAQLYLDLTNASDHLPVVVDYTVPLPAPIISGIGLAGDNLVLSVTNGITNATYSVWTATNLTAPFTQWTALTTNVANGGNFTVIVTNAVDPSVTGQFFLLQGR